MQKVFICGSALKGQPDHKTIRSAQLLGAIKTQPWYRMHSAQNGWHPAVFEVGSGGVTLAGELYKMSNEQYEELLAGEPPNLYPGQVTLENGSLAIAMLYPKSLVEKFSWPDISHFGGWTAYKQHQLASQTV